MEVDNIKPQKIVSFSPLVTVLSSCPQAYKDDVYLGPKDTDEEVAEWHFPGTHRPYSGYTNVKVETLSRASFTNRY